MDILTDQVLMSAKFVDCFVKLWPSHFIKGLLVPVIFLFEPLHIFLGHNQVSHMMNICNIFSSILDGYVGTELPGIIKRSDGFNLRETLPVFLQLDRPVFVVDPAKDCSFYVPVLGDSVPRVSQSNPSHTHVEPFDVCR